MQEQTDGYEIKIPEGQEVVLRRDNGTVEQGITQDNKLATLSRLYVMWLVFRRAFPMYMSYTFSFEVFVLIVLSNYMNNGQGQNNINAATLSSTAMQLTVALGISTLLPVSFLTSIKRGQLNIAIQADEIEKINTAISAAMKHIVALTVLNSTVVVPLIFSKTIFTNLFGQNSDVAELASSFAMFYAPVVALLILRSGFEQIMFGLNHQTPAMLMALFTFILGSGFAYLLGYGVGPFPKWGYPGIAAGFGIDALTLCIMNALYLGLHKDFKDMHFFRNLFSWDLDDFRQIKTILSIGYPIAIAFLVEYGSDTLMAIWSGDLGTYQQAALNFTSAAKFFLIPGIIALGQAICNEVSTAIGEQKWGNASRFARYGLLGSVLAITALSIPPAVYPTMLTFALTNITLNSEVSSYLKVLMPLTSASISIYTTGYCMLQTLRPAGDAHWPTVNNIFAIGMGLLTQYLLAFHTNFGIYGLYIGLLMATLLAAALLADRWIPRTSPEAFERNARKQALELAAQSSGTAVPQKTSLSDLTNCLPGVLREGVFGKCRSMVGERQPLIPPSATPTAQDISPRTVF